MFEIFLVLYFFRFRVRFHSVWTSPYKKFFKPNKLNSVIYRPIENFLVLGFHFQSGYTNIHDVRFMLFQRRWYHCQSICAVWWPSQYSFQCSFQCSIPPFHSANSRQLTNSVEKRNSWNQGQMALQFKDITRTFLIYMHLWWYFKLCIKIDSTTHINDYINKTFHIHKFYVISHTPTPLLYYIQVQL